MRFLKKVEEKARRYDQIRHLLEDPAVTQDQSRMRDLGKELRLLETITALYRDYLRVEEESDEAGFWLEIVKEAGLASAGLVDPLLKEADELTAIFARSTMTARQSANHQ